MFAKTTLTAIVAFVALGFTASAHAAPAGESASVTVQTAGLNLHSEEGAAIALNRIRLAATRVCGGEPSPKALGPLTTYNACMKATVDHAVASVDSPMLASLNGTPKSSTFASVTH